MIAYLIKDHLEFQKIPGTFCVFVFSNAYCKTKNLFVINDTFFSLLKNVIAYVHMTTKLTQLSKLGLH